MFGASVSETADGFAVGTPKAVFTPGDTVAYIAHLREPPGATVIERRPVAVSPGGIETFARRYWLHLASPDATLLAGSLGQVCKGCTTAPSASRRRSPQPPDTIVNRTVLRSQNALPQKLMTCPVIGRKA